MLLARCKSFFAALALLGSALAVAGCGALSSDYLAGADAGLEAGVESVREASEAFSRYHANKNDPEALVNYSKALRKIGSHKKAFEVLSDAPIKPRDSAMVAAELVRTHLEVGALQDGEQVARTVLNFFPENSEIRQLLALSLAQQGHNLAAQEIYAELYAQYPNDRLIMNNYAMSLLLTRDLERSLPILEQAANSYFSDSRARQNYALALGLSGNLKGAREQFLRDLPTEAVERNIALISNVLTSGSNNIPAPLLNLSAADDDLEVKPAPQIAVDSARLLEPAQLEPVPDAQLPATASITPAVTADAAPIFTVPLPPSRVKLFGASERDLIGDLVGVTGDGLSAIPAIDTTLQGANTDDLLRGTVGQ